MLHLSHDPSVSKTVGKRRYKKDIKGHIKVYDRKNGEVPFALRGICFNETSSETFCDSIKVNYVTKGSAMYVFDLYVQNPKTVHTVALIAGKEKVILYQYGDKLASPPQEYFYPKNIVYK